MKKFYSLFVAVLVAVTAFAQGGRMPKGQMLPVQLQTKTLLKSVAKQPKMAKRVFRTTEAAPENYVRVTTAPSDWEGQYLIVYEEGSLAFNGGLTDKLDVAAGGATIAVEISDQEIAATETTDAASFTIAKVDGGYTIQGQGGLYIGHTGTANGLASSATQAYVNAIDIDEDANADVMAETGFMLRFNASQGQERFRYFKPETYTKQQPIALYKKGGEKTEPYVPTLVELPEGLETEPYTVGGAWIYYGDDDWEIEELNYTVQVAFQGNDIYVQGLSLWSSFTESWVKGTIQGDKVVFENYQFMGEDEYGYDFLFAFELTDEGEILPTENMVFDYDAETRSLSLAEENLIGETSKYKGTSVFNYTYMMTLTPGEAVEPEVVVVPEGLEVAQYTFKASVYEEYEEDYDDEYYAAEEGGDEEEEEVAELITFVGFDGDDVYVRGLCEYLPNAWVKGTRQGNTIVLPSGQYFGTYDYLGFYEFDMYFVGLNEEFDLADVVLNISEDGNVLIAQNMIAVNSQANTLAPYEVYIDATFTKVIEKAGTPEAPYITDFEDYDEDNEYGYVEFAIPVVDTEGNPLVVSKLSYVIYTDIDGTVSPYTFTTDLYESLDEDATEMPFLFNSDDFDINPEASYVMFYAPTDNIDRIGIKSIYRGGGETHETEIDWYTIEHEYETGLISLAKQSDAKVIYNLAGQRVAKTTKGLYIVNGKKVVK